MSRDEALTLINEAYQRYRSAIRMAAQLSIEHSLSMRVCIDLYTPAWLNYQKVYRQAIIAGHNFQLHCHNGEEYFV